ncbi:hypothetical protein K461DRAFT_277540 [Myriangium duriaei CBS 260.36]|uniref:Rhodopsin domain-containing protein n=1 Tax=Myriangium duriaei CBS 260.36 TaxID=1168546 RepID=A0A9P4MP72_9PEZI|nr:hypothetical protein K461DRAFT_277540 [Myriangium duriaei CBS 260.36]
MAFSTPSFPENSGSATAASSASMSTDTTMVDSLNSQVPPDLHIARTIALNVIIFLVTTVCFSLRIHVRQVVIKDLGLDDYLLMAAYGIFTVLISLFLAIVIDLQTNGLIPRFWISFELGQIWYLISGLTTVLIRVAIAAFFLRIIPNHDLHRPQRLTITIASYLYALFMVTSSFTILFQCGSDVTGSNPASVCMDPDALSYLIDTLLVSTTIIDWLMTLIPLAIVARSAMPTRAKLLAMAVILLGALGSVISIIRIPFNDLGFVSGPLDLGHYITWLLLALLENCMGIIAISLAALRPLFRRVFRDDAPTVGEDVPGILGGVQVGQEKNVVFLAEFQVDEWVGPDGQYKC